jgi:hypothetical protein
VKILLISRFDNARYAHPALYQRALERLGATVAPFNLERTGWIDRLTRKDLTVRLEHAIRHASPDVILVTDTEVLRDGAILPLRHVTRARWVFWFPRQEDTLAAPPSATIATDTVFVAGSLRAAHWSRLDGIDVHPLDAACDPSVHRPLKVRDPFRANVVFVGSATPYRESVLHQLVEFGLALWGPGWKKSGLREYCRGELLSLENYVRAYAGASVAINLHRDAEGPEPDGAVNSRLFEIAAIGVAQAVEKRRELAAHFQPDEEILGFGSVEELRDQVRHALQDHHLRERLGSAARRTALQRHTYMHRMKELLDQLMG